MFDTDKFIQCVQESTAIWEKGSQSYSDKNLREKSWFIVGEYMFDMWEDMTDGEKQEQVREMKNKWRHIRDNYAKYINQGSSGDPTSNKKKKYVYADALSFLLPSIKRRRTSRGMANEIKDDEYCSREDDEANDTEATTSATFRTTSSFKKSVGLRKTQDVTAFQSQLLEKLDASQSGEEDADKHFLLSLIPDLKKLNDDEKLDFRFHTLQFFRDIRKKNRLRDTQ